MKTTEGRVLGTLDLGPMDGAEATLAVARDFWGAARPRLSAEDARILARAGMPGCTGFVEWLKAVPIEPLARSLPFLAVYTQFLVAAGLHRDHTVSSSLQRAVSALDDALPKWRLATVLTKLERPRRKAGGARAVFSISADIDWSRVTLDCPFDTEGTVWDRSTEWKVSPQVREQLLALGRGRSAREACVGYIYATEFEPRGSAWYDGSERYEGSYPRFTEATLGRLDHNPELAARLRRVTFDDISIDPELNTDEPGVMRLEPYQVTQTRTLLAEIQRVWTTGQRGDELARECQEAGYSDDPLLRPRTLRADAG